MRAVEPPKADDPAWNEHAIDRFIFAKLKEHKLTPSPQAKAHVLERRLSYDLTGLPPEASKPASVDDLLKSPHFGEHFARLWLDVARYADTANVTVPATKMVSYYPYAFTYRDYVISAFNADKPYDQFIKEQLAADLMGIKDRSPEQAALGFIAVTPFLTNPNDFADDMIDTTMRGFMGLTVACARCHDHKFDPIPTSDYYALVGVFASTDYAETPLVSPAEIEEAQKTLTEKEKQMKEKDRPKKYPFAHSLTDRSQPKTMKVHVRGNPDTLAEVAPRQFLSIIIYHDEAGPFQQGSGRRIGERNC